MALYGKIGEFKPKFLLADPNTADVIGIPCEPGEGTIAAGTVMYRKENGMYAPADAAACVDTNYLAVLGEDVDIDANAEICENALAYRAGSFVKGVVTLKDSAKVEAAQAVVLRKQGIVLDPMESKETFNNKKSD